MNIQLLLLISALIQFAAAYLAFRMIRLTKQLPAWTLISFALLLMGIRRLTTYLGFVFPNLSIHLKGMGAETIALTISGFMFVSMILIRRYLLEQKEKETRLRQSEKTYRELSDELEDRVEEKTRYLLDTTFQLQKAGQVRSEFLGKMSHELRTPLNAVIGFSDILLSGMDGDLNHEQKKDAQVIFNSAQHLLDLINDILDFSKLREGRVVLKTKPISVTEVVSDILKSFRKNIREKGLVVNDNIPEGLTPVHADPFRLEQILNNLIGNAVKFTPSGSITIQADYSKMNGSPPASMPEPGPKYIRISVKDTGVGISKKDIPLIFESFHQSESGSARTYEGTGLGLAISKHLVELHGGMIGVDSRNNQGSCFWFTLPCLQESTETTGTMLT